MKVISVMVVSMLAISAPAFAGDGGDGCPMKSAKREELVKLVKDRRCDEAQHLAKVCASGDGDDTAMTTAGYEVCRAPLQKEDLALLDSLVKRCEDKIPANKAYRKNEVANCKLIVAVAVWVVRKE